MELKILSPQNAEVGKKKLPKQFEEPVRADLIKRAVEAIQSHNRQQYGADPRAGLKHSADLSKRRRKYRGSYGHGISRVPRKITSRRGDQFNWTAAIVPGVVIGRGCTDASFVPVLCRTGIKIDHSRPTSLWGGFNLDSAVNRSILILTN